MGSAQKGRETSPGGGTPLRGTPPGQATAALDFGPSLAKLWDLLDSRERRRLVWVLGAMLLVGLVETAGVGSIAPFMALVSDPGVIQRNDILSAVYAYLGFESSYAFLLLAGACVLVFIVVSNGFSALITWVTLRFIWGIHHRISRDLLNGYLWRPYTFFITRNTSDLSTKILSEVNSIAAGMLISGMKALTRATVAIGILVLLVVVDYKLALISASVLGGAYLAIYLGVRSKLADIGAKRLSTNTRRFRAAGEALQGIKDVKVLGREDAFLTRYATESLAFSRHSATSQIIAAMPRFALETIAFGGMVSILLYLMAVRAGFERAVPIISLYAFAGYRLIPAVQQVFDGLARFRFYGPSLIALHTDMVESRADTLPAPPGDEVPLPRVEKNIELRDIVFSYPGSDTPVVRGVSLQIRKKQTVALVGATGCGKTTLADIVMGLLWPQEGEILLDGRVLVPANARSWQRQLGYVPQHIFLSDDTIARNIAFGVPSDEVDISSVEEAARIANLHRFIDMLPDRYATVVGDRGVRLSGGQRQRLGIARALYSDPDVLVLDEATSALDGVTEEAVMDAIHALTNRKTIVLIAHRLTTVRDAHVIFLMKDGEIIAEGSHAELIVYSAEFRAMAGVSP